MLTNLLIYRFALINTAFAVVAGYAVNEGWAADLYGGDITHLTLAITVLFIVAWIWTAREIIAAGTMLNRARRRDPLPATAAMRDKDIGKIEWLGECSGWLVGLGLLGTVIGFSIALGSIDKDSLASASGVSTSVQTLMSGMAVAINTTILGTVLGLWNEVNVRMLTTALNSYWSGRLDAIGR
jgi:hypothetical protein